MIKRHIRAKVSVQIPLSLYGALIFFELMLAQGNGCYTYAKVWLCV